MNQTRNTLEQRQTLAVTALERVLDSWPSAFSYILCLRHNCRKRKWGRGGAIICWILPLVHLGSYNTRPQTGWLTNNTNVFLAVLKAGNPRSRCQHSHLWVRASSWLMAGLLAVSPHMVEGARELSRAQGIPLMRVLPSWLKHLPKSPPPHTIIFEGSDVSVRLVREHIHLDHCSTELRMPAAENTRKAVDTQESQTIMGLNTVDPPPIVKV